MPEVEVRLRGEERAYTITIDHRARLPEVVDFDRYSRVALLTDQNVAAHWLEEIQSLVSGGSEPIVIPPGENEKNLATVETIWSRLAALGLDRSSLLVLLGGGVVGDIGGFAASTYMRGIDFLPIPTTLLSQVDASVGGKVGVNALGGKNLIGCITQPVAVFIDPELLTTLDQRNYRAGFAEILKHGLIADSEYFTTLPAALADDPRHRELPTAIVRSCGIKAGFVVRDEREEGIRKALNFGHTIGHALESVSLEGPEPLLHGEAVSLGMLTEAMLSRAVGLTDPEISQIRRRLEEFGLPVSIPESIDLAAVIERIQLDKKKRGDAIAWTLLETVGRAAIDCHVEPERIREALECVERGVG